MLRRGRVAKYARLGRLIMSRKFAVKTFARFASKFYGVFFVFEALLCVFSIERYEHAPTRAIFIESDALHCGRSPSPLIEQILRLRATAQIRPGIVEAIAVDVIDNKPGRQKTRLNSFHDEAMQINHFAFSATTFQHSIASTDHFGGEPFGDIDVDFVNKC